MRLQTRLVFHADAGNQGHQAVVLQHKRRSDLLSMLGSLLMNMAELTVNVNMAKNSTTAARRDPYIGATASRQARKYDRPGV